MYCWTNEQSNYLQPKAPGGGGFGCELITLKWLFKEWIAHRNIWTTSNEYLDLVRYTGCSITIYRHPTIDFIFYYERQPPFDISIHTYPEIHPLNAMLKKHKKVLLSRASKPRGKNYIKIKIKPPKQMITKWFFQQDFCQYGLIKLCAAAADFSYPRISPIGQSTILTIFSLDINFYNNSNWAQTKDVPYKPYPTAPTTIYFKKYVNKNWVRDTIGPFTTSEKYYESISYEKGYFQTGLISGKVYTDGKYDTLQGTQPLITLRYNPEEDDGVGNEIYLTSIMGGHYDKPPITEDYHINNVPLWMGFYGYYNYLLATTKDKGLFTHKMFVVKSKALKPLSQPSAQSYYPLIDREFIDGKLPWDEYLSANEKKLWYPTAEKQTVTINAIVQCGPFVPKLDNLKYSTWELNYKYEFFFKWGGPQTGNPPIEDPCTRKKYPVPDTVQQAIQVTDPEKQYPQGILHAWDFRRGYVTPSALKRVSDNIQPDSYFESDDSEPEKKKKKVTKELPYSKEKQEEINQCLLSLCEETTCQETENLQLFIQQQHQQQQHLRKNILKLLTFLKRDQTQVQMQTGMLI